MVHITKLQLTKVNSQLIIFYAKRSNSDVLGIPQILDLNADIYLRQFGF